MHPALSNFLNILIIPINGIFSLMGFSEFYKVSIKKDISQYPFGTEGPVPYYYKTPELYSSLAFIYGLIFLCMVLLGIWNWIRKKIHGLLMMAITLVLITLLLLHSLT